MSIALTPGGSSYHGSGYSYGHGYHVYNYGYNYGYGGGGYGLNYGYGLGYGDGGYGEGNGYAFGTGGCSGASLSKGNFCIRDPGSVHKKPIIVSWAKPKPGCFKLNTDGASKGNPGASSVGGIIRDSDGKWFSGFHQTIGFATSLKAELWALRDGLSLAKNKGLGRDELEVEVDATAVLKLVEDRRDRDLGNLRDLVLQCRSLLEWFGLMVPKHVYREANQCADILANYHVVNKGAIQDGWPEFKSAPSCVEYKMLADASESIYIRNPRC